jgi:hypothetical protein
MVELVTTGEEGLCQQITRESAIQTLDALYQAIQEAERQSSWLRGFDGMTSACSEMIELWNRGVDSLPRQDAGRWSP